MRISDWSSDVCSSDLCHRAPHLEPVRPRGVAAHIGRRTGGHGLDLRARRARLRPLRGGSGTAPGVSAERLRPKPLPAMDVAGRARRLQRALDDLGSDAPLVTHLTNLRYLPGFTGSAAPLVVLPGALV